MRQINKTELKNILKNHKLWLESNGEKGERADLSGTNLSGTNLSGANLTFANLTEVNLSRANLSEANLSRAYLLRADLSRGFLANTSLAEAFLACANLSEADLSGANLSGASLSRADLSEANLLLADLSEANLSGTNLFNIKNKKIICFQYNKHSAYYCDGLIKIGCKTMTKEEWLEKGREIGKENNYTENEINEYMSWIKNIRGVV